MAHQARLRLPPLNRRQRHNTQTPLYLHLLPAPAVSPADEMQSNVRHNCAQTRCWLRWSPIAFSARCAASGSSFARIARTVRTHGSSTGVNVSFDSQSHQFNFFSFIRTINLLFFHCAVRRRQRLKQWGVRRTADAPHLRLVMSRVITMSSMPKAMIWTQQKMPMRLWTPMQPIIMPHGMLTWVPPRTGMSLLSLHSKAMTDRAHVNPTPSRFAYQPKIDSYPPMILVIDIAIWDGSRVVAFFSLLHLCRLNFTRHSITYLFSTTYTPSDALTIAALVAYMNAAFPPDKHEEFDTAEVTRAAKTLHDRGNVAFEGDTLKLLH